MRPNISYVFEKPYQNLIFVRFVEYLKWSFIFRTGGVFEILDVGGNDFTIDDQISLKKFIKIKKPARIEYKRTKKLDLSIDHVRYHDNLVNLRIGKFQRRFCSFDIER